MHTGSATGSVCASSPGAIDAATTAFIDHLFAAHLETSPSDQLKAILANPSNYVLTHTALVEAMVATGAQDVEQLGAVLEQVSTLFWNHIYSAHLSQSPAQQLQAILSNPNAYAELHTVWAETLLQPLTQWFGQLLGGSASAGCAAPAGATGTTGVTGSASAGGGGVMSKSVMIMNYAFAPASTTVSVGTKVTWTNMDSVAHTITSKSAGPLSSPNIPPSGSWSYTFTSPGTYQYYCAIHPNMTGTIIVQ